MCNTSRLEKASSIFPTIQAAPVSPAGRPAGRRRRIWEVDGHWHCSIIGTCLSLGDLRALARKLGIDARRDLAFPADYQLHGYFVGEADKQNRAARLLTKLLDRKHATAIKRLPVKASADDLAAHWRDALETGDIPGPYWALLTHPSAANEFRERMFAEVHMLSHLVGASNRGDIRALRALGEENDGLRRDLAEARRRHRRTVEAKEATIREQQADLARLRAMRGEASAAVPAVVADDGACRAIPVLQGELQRIEREADRSARIIAGQQARLADLEREVADLRHENRSLEQALTGGHSEESGECPLDLGGRCLLYVGGRKKTVQQLRTLVSSWNGDLLHHDGGIEKSIHELAGAVSRADTVIFPCDCISHEAVRCVKRLCRQQMKPCVPLRSSGLAPFLAAVAAANDDGSDGGARSM